MEKIAVLSDIHGNLEALKTCLKDIEERKISRIICLGDVIAKGVHPMECIALLKEKKAIFIRGNCDRFFSENYQTDQITPRIKFNQDMVDEKTRDFLYNLPMVYECYVSGTYIRFVHASPWKDDEFIGSSTSLETEYKMFLPTKHTSDKIADVVIYGHTHTPYVNKAYHHTLINAGSVGNSMDVFQNDEHPGNYQQTCKACYLIIEGIIDTKEDGPISYMHVHLPYNIEKELQSPKYNVEKEAYEKELRYGKYRDLNKMKLQKK